jgi:hypothetical protein
MKILVRTAGVAVDCGATESHKYTVSRGAEAGSIVTMVAIAERLED